MSTPFVGGAKLRGADLYDYIVRDVRISDVDYKAADGTITSTSYSNALGGVGSFCAVIFRAKASGMVLIGSTAVMKNNTAATRTLCSYQIRKSPTIAVGGVIQSPTDSNALMMIGTEERTCTRVELLTGFTPDEYYNIQQHYRVSGGTGTYSNKSMFALPL